jgi:hypothetical protein
MTVPAGTHFVDGLLGRAAWRSCVLALLLTAGGCEDESYRAIGAEVKVLIKDANVPEEAAAARLQAFGRKAIPQIEIALHTAPERGRGRLFKVLEAIGHEETVPILRHFAVYDDSPALQETCASVLARWGAVPDRRGERARQALDFVAASRSRGEGPLRKRTSL